MLIGLILDLVVASLLLNLGVTFASFNSSGNLQLYIAELMQAFEVT